jgi:hypothetical protein
MVGEIHTDSDWNICGFYAYDWLSIGGFVRENIYVLELKFAVEKIGVQK